MGVVSPHPPKPKKKLDLGVANRHQNLYDETTRLDTETN